MGRILRVLLGLVAMAICTSTIAQPAAADQIGSTINFRVSDTFPDLTYNEITKIQRGLKSAVDFNRKKTPWICVSSPTLSDEVLGDLGEQFRPTGVFIYVAIGRRPDGDAFVTEMIWVAGKKTATQTGAITKTLLEGDRATALRDEAVHTLEQLMEQVTPCAPKVKVKAKTKLTQDLIWTGGWEGEARLALGESGDFAGTLPVIYSWTPIIIPDGVCTATIPNPRSLMDIAGHFEGGDKSLKFTRMQLHGISGNATVSCTTEGQTITRTMALPIFAPMEAATQYDVRIPLQQDARIIIALRPPAPGAISDFTMDLTYEEDGTPVAVVSVGGAALRGATRSQH